MAVKGAADRIRESVMAWGQVKVVPHRFGGQEYLVGRREIGHVHGDHLVDIPFPKRIRDEIVGAGLAEAHHVLPESGWISLFLRDENDVERAIVLLRRSYEIALQQHVGRSTQG